MKHAVWMVIGCVLPFLVIFLLPKFGVSGNVSFLLFAVLMLGCHLMMMVGHDSHDHDHDRETRHGDRGATRES